MPDLPQPDIERAYKSVQPLRTFFSLLGQRVSGHLLLFFIFFLKALPQLALPLVIAESIRVAGGDMADPWGYLLKLYGVYALILFSNIPTHLYYIRCSSRITRSLELRLRATLVRRLQQLSMHFHSERETGRTQSKILRDVEEIVRLCDLYFLMAMGAVLNLLFAFGYTLAEEPIVALFYLLATPLAIGLIHFFRSKMRRRNDSLRIDFEQMSQRVGEMMNMVPVTRAHGVEEIELHSVRQQLEKVHNRGREVDHINALFGSTSFVVFLGTVLAIIVAVTGLVIEGRFGVDKIALYAALFQMVVGSVQGLLAMVPQVNRSLASLRSLGEILECPDLEENDGKATVGAVCGHIDLREVGFFYPGQSRPAIDALSLTISPGACIAFVGPSGSGKSTLMQIIIGFLRPQQGQVLHDGQPMESIDMRTWRRQIAMVPQQTILFSGTLRENISYGLSDIDDTRIAEALEIARLDEVVAGLPQGLETLVGEDGLKLSGGQRQRLAIARAVVRDPKIIIFDEATSALDAVSEREVQSAIENLIRGRTTLIVAHRLSTIRQADHVVVLRGGRIVEQGSLADLEAADGPFSHLKAASV